MMIDPILAAMSLAILFLAAALLMLAVNRPRSIVDDGRDQYREVQLDRIESAITSVGLTTQETSGETEDLDAEDDKTDPEWTKFVLAYCRRVDGPPEPGPIAFERSPEHIPPGFRKNWCPSCKSDECPSLSGPSGRCFAESVPIQE